jgi:hypothetical protein
MVIASRSRRRWASCRSRRTTSLPSSVLSPMQPEICLFPVVFRPGTLCVEFLLASVVSRRKLWPRRSILTEVRGELAQLWAQRTQASCGKGRKRKRVCRFFVSHVFKSDSLEISVRDNSNKFRSVNSSRRTSHCGEGARWAWRDESVTIEAAPWAKAQEEWTREATRWRRRAQRANDDLRARGALVLQGEAEKTRSSGSPHAIALPTAQCISARRWWDQAWRPADRDSAFAHRHVLNGWLAGWMVGPNGDACSLAHPHAYRKDSCTLHTMLSSIPLATSPHCIGWHQNQCIHVAMCSTPSGCRRVASNAYMAPPRKSLRSLSSPSFALRPHE